MKTLVLHPDDRSTDFLDIIYKGKGYTVIRDLEIKKSDLMKQIKKHNRIMMMGHGTPYGLLGYSYIFMDKNFIKLLQTKNSVCIWCHANIYVAREGIHGFSTSMFISEIDEGTYYGINATQEQIDYSNNLFVTEFRKVESMINCFNLIKESYNDNDPVIQFNNKGLLVFE